MVEITEIKRYAKKRDEVLNKFDVKIFKNWLYDNNRKIYKQIMFFNSTPQAEIVLLAIMCKMCINSTGTTEKVKEKTKKELDKLGMDYEIE